MAEKERRKGNVNNYALVYSFSEHSTDKVEELQMIFLSWDGRQNIMKLQ